MGCNCKQGTHPQERILQIDPKFRNSWICPKCGWVMEKIEVEKRIIKACINERCVSYRKEQP